MKALVPMFALVLSIGFYSCSKEKSFEIPDPTNPDPAVTLIGKWSFVELQIDMETSLLQSQGGIRAETVSRYKDTTTKNSGEINIEAGTISGNHAYTVDTYLYTKMYVNGIEVGEVPPYHLDIDVKGTASTTPYNKIGEDSLYFPQGTVFAVPIDPSSTTIPPSEPSGVKYAIRSDTLFMYASQLQDISKDADTEVKANGSIVAIYKKQR